MFGEGGFLDLTRILLTLPAILIGFAFHEFAHAWTADRLGDPTPRNQGRLTLSPLVHIDPIGFLLILFIGFGWAKPVMTNPRNYKNPKRDDLLVSISGPLMNLLLAFVFGVLLKIFYVSGLVEMLGFNTFENIVKLFAAIMYINILLFIFNLLPIPPLDGFHVLANTVLSRNYKALQFLHQYGFLILIVFIFIGGFRRILVPLIMIVFNIIKAILGIP